MNFQIGIPPFNAPSPSILDPSIKSFEESLNYLPWSEVFKHHNKIIFFTIFKPFYFLLGIGKAFLYLLNILGLTPVTVSDYEKRGNLKKIRCFRLPNSLAHLALTQWKKLEKFLDHRKRLALMYESELKLGKKLKFNDEAAYLRYPLFVPDPDKIFSFLKKKQIQIMNDWNGSVIFPKDSDLYSAGYIKGMCPNAENLGKSILTLPVSPNVRSTEAKNLINILDRIQT